jgi:predicted Zn-dependent protease
MEDTASKTKGFLWVGLAILIALIFIFGLAPLAHAVPWSWETKLGHVLNSSSDQELIHDPETNAILQKIVRRIYPLDSTDKAFNIDVRVIRKKELNAHTELGGNISINSELLCKAESPEEIAGILAHEIEHVHHRHLMEGMISYIFTAEGLSMIFSSGHSNLSSLTHYFINMRFNRSQESVADKSALIRLQKAHVTNLGFKEFFTRMEKMNSNSDFLSDHPSNQSRLSMAEKFENRGATPVLTSQEWKVIKNSCAKTNNFGVVAT